MENLEKPKLWQEIQPQKVEKIEEEKLVSIEQPLPQPEMTADKEQEQSKRAENDALALKKVREELGIPVVDKNIQDSEVNVRIEVSPTEKAENGEDRKLNDSFNVVSAHIDDFQSSLRGNRFNRISFNSDELKRIGTMEQFDPKKASETIQGVTRSFKRDFLPEDPEERMSLETHNFTRVIESIDKLRGQFIKLRSSVEDEKHPGNEEDYKKLAVDISDSINVMRRKKDGLEETRSALRRLRER